MTKSISLAAAVAAALTSGVAMAELTGNAAITNNYIWRGVTPVSYTHLTLPTTLCMCRSRWSPYH